ncbi:MAG TPA: translocation/assembly module TamB domain-containing protein, partial [Blastocatellia bacterium]|nr:translocation/assembly module TamB domain-containing protein [Blastocatellia bacterium]
LTLTNVALQLEGRPVEIQTPVTVALNGPEITVSPTRVSGPGIDLNLGGTVAFREEARLDFGLKGTVRLEQLPQFNPDVFLSGMVTLDAQLTGNTDAPNLTGEVVLSNLGLTATDLPVAFEGGSGRVALSGDRVTLESFTARANDGELTAGGSATLKQLRPAEWRFTIAAKEVEVFYQGARGLLNADLALAGTPEGQVLSGEVTIPQAEYAVNFDFGGALSGGGGGLGFGSFDASGGRRRSAFAPLSLNVRVEANESILIRNEQVNTVGSALVTLGGPVADPSVTGQITFEGGTIKFRGSRYELTAGRVDLLGGLGTQPNLNFAAEGDVSGYRVYIGLDGALNDIQVSLRAEPQLSRAEVLQLITTGRTESSTIAGNQALYGGAGAAASLISEELISKPTEEFLGLSRFQLDPVIRPNSNPAARLTIGRQLTRDLQFTYSTNLSSQQDQTAIVEYTLTNRFSALASFTQGGSTAQGTGANNDFTVEMRARRRFGRGFGRDDAGAAPAPADAGGVVRENLKRATLPQAEVEVEPVEGIKLGSRRLRELIPVIPQGYSRPLARLGERNLTNYLQENGYFFAEVAARCQPADCAGPDLKVLYDITPGARYDLKELRVEGTNTLNIGDVSRELESQKASLFGGVPLLGRLPFVGGYVRGLTSNDRLRQDRETIRRRLVDLGFRAAQVDANLAVRPEDDHLVVIFRVAEGPRSTVAEIAVRGNVLIAAPELREAVKIDDGDYFSLTRAREGGEQIRGHYTGRGFLEAAAELEIIDLPENRVRLAYRVSEGARSRVAEVAVTGLTKTREESLRRLLDLKDGEVLTPEKIRNTQRTLYATGAFREVNVRAEPVGGEDETLRKVTIQVTEAKPFLFVYGLGYSTDRGPSGLIEVTDTNFMNRVNSASLRVRGSRVEQLAQLTYINPRPFGEKWPTTVSVYYNRNSNLAPFVRRAVIDEDLVEEQKEGYGLSRLAAFIQTERKLDPRTSLRFRYNLERAKLFNLENIPDTEVTRFERATRLGAFSAGISRDTRDSALNATRGQLVSADHQVAARIFGGNESFNKFFGVFQRYHTVDPERRLVGNSVLAFSARVGLAALFRPVDRDENGVIDEEERLLPISERFFAGGATTLRGFSFDTAGPQDILEPTNPNELPTLVPLGGDASVLLNFEFRYPLTKRLRLVPFYDLGNVFRRVGDISWANMTNTVGLGLRVDTPVGPIGVDYGFLIDPPAFVTQSGAVLRQPRGAFHIRFGQTF